MLNGDYCGCRFLWVEVLKICIVHDQAKNPHLDFNDVDFEELLGMKEDVEFVKVVEDVIPLAPKIVGILIDSAALVSEVCVASVGAPKLMCAWLRLMPWCVNGYPLPM